MISNRLTSDLERLLPDTLKNGAVWSGDELVLQYAEALRAIAIASEHQIAVLGLEAFEVREDGLQTVDLADASSYICFAGNWTAYVARMNAEPSTGSESTAWARTTVISLHPHRRLNSKHSQSA